MSYTLRGRIETRLAAALLPFARRGRARRRSCTTGGRSSSSALMLAIGLALDVALYHRLLPYQPGWAAVPLGLLELGLTMAPPGCSSSARRSGRRSLFFAGAWLLAQVLAHAGLPLLRLTLAGGRRRARPRRPRPRRPPRRSALLAVLGIAWAVEPPTVHLAAGVHQGPLVLDHAQTVVGEPGAIVRGGIVITADDVTVRNVTVRGGEYGIEVDGAESVELDDVVVEGAELDGINVRRSQVEIRDCAIRSLPAACDAGDRHLLRLRPARRASSSGCTVVGGQRGDRHALRRW